MNADPFVRPRADAPQEKVRGANDQVFGIDGKAGVAASQGNSVADALKLEVVV
jgi:hypothetical protein